MCQEELRETPKPTAITINPKEENFDLVPHPKSLIIYRSFHLKPKEEELVQKFLYKNVMKGAEILTVSSNGKF